MQWKLFSISVAHLIMCGWGASATYTVETLVRSGSKLKTIAGIRFLGRGNKFLIADLVDGNVKEITKKGDVKGIAIEARTIVSGDELFGFADDFAISSDAEHVSSAGLITSQVIQRDKMAFGQYDNPQLYNGGAPVPPFFPSQLGFPNPIAYDANDVLYCANIPIIGLPNGVFRMSLTGAPVEFELFDVANGVLDTTSSLNAFDFGPDGKLYSPSPSRGSVLQITLTEGASGPRAEYTEIVTGLSEPISVRVNDEGLLVVLDRDTGFVWKYQLGQDTEPSCVASLEPGLDNFDFLPSCNKILVTANRNRIWEVKLHNGHVKTRLASPIALPRTISAGKAVDDFDRLYVADNYAIVIVNLFTGEILDALTPSNTPSLADFNFIDAIYTNETTLYVLDRRIGRIAALDRQSLSLLDSFGTFAPGSPIISQATYLLDDHNGELLVAAAASGKVFRVKRVNGLQVNEVVVDNVAAPVSLARDGSTLYISDLGTDDTSGAVYTIDLTAGTTQATLLKDELARPKGLAVQGDDVLVIESAAARITAIDPSGVATVIADDLDIQYAPIPSSFSTPVPVGVLSDIVVSQNGTVFFGANTPEGAVQYLDS